MPLHATVHGGVRRLRVQGEMNIYTAGEMKGALMRELGATHELEVDLHEVEELDTAGLQLLIMLRREGREAGKEVRLVGHSPAVLEVMDICNLARWFGDPLVASDRSAGC